VFSWILLTHTVLGFIEAQLDRMRRAQQESQNMKFDSLIKI